MQRAYKTVVERAEEEEREKTMDRLLRMEKDVDAVGVEQVGVVEHRRQQCYQVMLDNVGENGVGWH